MLSGLIVYAGLRSVRSVTLSVVSVPCRSMCLHDFDNADGTLSVADYILLPYTAMCEKVLTMICRSVEPRAECTLLIWRTVQRNVV